MRRFRITRTALLLFALLLFLIATRLCHSGILWSDGDYHLAAAMQVHHGKTLYRDLWYDKPPLTALFMDGFGRPQGWRLSLLEALVAWAGCVFAFLTARSLGGEKAGWIAGALLAFFLTFYIPTAVIPIAPDLLMIAPHLAAVWCVFAKRPRWAGACAAVAFGINVKGIFVLIACLAIAPTQAVPLLLGFAVPSAAGALALLYTGAWNGYVEQVWRWSLLYARNAPLAGPVALGLNAVNRTLNWAGFHGALVLGAILFFAHERLATKHAPNRDGNHKALRCGLWLAISLVAVAQGMRFLPRYYFQLLAPLTVVAALGLASGWTRTRQRVWIPIALAVALLIPLIRFGPEYITLALDNLRSRPHRWTDLALDQDDQAVAAALTRRIQAGNTLFVWGYRPGIYVYSRLDSPSLFWDSQPLTGVPADRHLISALAVDAAGAQRNRLLFAREVAKRPPTFFVDALSRFNPALAPGRYPELRPLLAAYRPCAQTGLTVVYCAP